MDKKRFVAILCGVFVFIGAYFFVHYGMVEKKERDNTTTYAKARVLEVLENNLTKDETTEQVFRGSQLVSVRITSGVHKGEIYEITNYLSALYQVNCKKGLQIIARIDKRTDGGYSVSVYNYDRQWILIGTLLVFALLLCVIGGRKGLMSLFSLTYTLLFLVFVLIPAIYYGAPVLPTTMIVIIVTNFVSFIMIDGINKKTLCASVGTCAGVLVAGIFAFVLGKLAHISGYQTNEAESLMLLSTDYGLKITDLFTAGILVSALGAVMDVAMSIASAINELHMVNENLTWKELFRSGMNIGKDAMGTMSNTLILAFVGSSMNLIIMIFSYQIPMIQLFATDLAAREIIQGISGSIGIIMTVPLVAWFSAFVYGKRNS